MKNILLISSLFLFAFSAQAQKDSIQSKYTNGATQLTQSDSKLAIGGYGEVHYNHSVYI